MRNYYATTRWDGDGVRNQAMKFINDYWRKHYTSPSMRDVAGSIGIAVSHAYNVINQLEDAKKILPRSRETRQIVPAWVKDAIENAQTKESKNA